MPKPFKGVVNVDIRDSVPDWEPFLQPKAPEGAPNVLTIVWDDVGYGTMDVFGGPVETPTMRRIAESGLRYSNFHTTALCSPTRSSCSPGATPRATTWRASPRARPASRVLGPDPVRERLRSAEVLDEHGWNTYASASGTSRRGTRATWPRGRAAGRSAAGSSASTGSSAARRTVVSRPRPRQPHDRAAGDARGGLPPLEGPDRQGDRVHPRRQGRRTREAVVHVLLPGCAHAPHHVFKEWADKYKGASTRATRRSARRSSQPEGARAAARRHRAVADQPARRAGATGPDGQPWPLLDIVRPWDSLTDDEKRLFARMAEVYAGFVSYTDDQIGAAASTTSRSPAARQHDHRRRLRQRRQRRGRPERLVQREQVLQQRSRHDRGEPRAPRRARQPDSYNHYNTGWAWAFDTPFPYWKRFAGYEGGVADMCLVAWPKGITGRRRRARPVRPRGRRRPDDLRPARHRAARGPQGLHAEPDRGRELRRLALGPGRPGKRDAVLLDARACARSTTRAGSRTRCTRRSPAGASSSSTSGSSTTSPRTAPSPRTSPPSTPSKLERAQGACGRTTPGSTRGCRSTTAPRSRSSQDVRAAAERAARPLRLLPGRGRGARVGRGQRSAALVHDRRGGGPRAPPRPKACSSRRARGPAATPLHQGRAASLHLQLARRARADRQLRASRCPPEATSSRAEFQKTGDDEQTMSATGTLTLYIDTDAVGSRRADDPARACSGSAAPARRVGRGNGSSVASTYTGTFPFVGGTIERVVIDVSGDHYVDHEKEVLAYLARD